jgi:hypothetical protein
VFVLRIPECHEERERESQEGEDKANDSRGMEE